MTSETEITLKYKVKVDDIDIDQLMNYNLTISVSHNEVTISVIDTISKKCLLGEKHEFEIDNSSTNILSILHSIIDEHHLLKARFWKNITITYNGKNFTLIPSSLVEEDNLEQYLELHGEWNKETEKIDSFRHKSIGITNIFSIPRDLENFFIDLYGEKVNFSHQTSSFIEGILNDQNTSSEKSIYANCEGNTISIAVLKSGKLEYCNQFNYNNSQDIVYYTLFVMNELYLNPENTPLTIWGDLDIKSEAYLELFKFVRNVNFGTRPSELTFSYHFDEIDEHQLFSSLSTYYYE